MLRLKHGNESGMAMIVALMITILGSILATSYMTVVISESKHSVWQKHRAQSLFLAEAGIEKGLYYLNNTDDPENPWVDEYGELLPTPLSYTGDLAEGNYQISIHDPVEQSWLPASSYLIKSTGTIDRPRSRDVEHRLSCIAARLDEIPIPAALAILDDADVEAELSNFQSSSWTVSGKDIDKFLGGLPGIAVANTGDNIDTQLGSRLDQVTGSNVFGDDLVGLDAILEDPALPKNLDAYANYFRKIGIDVSSADGKQYTIPPELLGSADNNQVLYADLSRGPLKLAGNTVGNGVLVLEGNGEFEMAGNSTWNGIIICAGVSDVLFKGGGATPSHIYGALLVADGTAYMNGTADIKYSSDNVSNVNAQLLLYQVYAWCGGWGTPIGSPS